MRSSPLQSPIRSVTLAGASGAPDPPIRGSGPRLAERTAVAGVAVRQAVARFAVRGAAPRRAGDLVLGLAPKEGIAARTADDCVVAAVAVGPVALAVGRARH